MVVGEGGMLAFPLVVPAVTVAAHWYGRYADTGVYAAMVALATDLAPWMGLLAANAAP